MSSKSKKTLYALLIADSTLAAALGDDEKGAPAVFNKTMNQLTKTSGWSHPAITFRQDDSPIDDRMRESVIGTEYFNLEVWANTESALTIPDIFAHLDRLLHNQTLTIEGGVCYDSVCVSASPDLYDNKLEAHFGLYRIKLTVGR